MRGPNTAVSRVFYVFAAVRAEFLQKTVMYLRAVQKLAFKHRTEGQHVRSIDLSHHKRGFRCFFSIIREICGICVQILLQQPFPYWDYTDCLSTRKGDDVLSIARDDDEFL